MEQAWTKQEIHAKFWIENDYLGGGEATHKWSCVLPRLYILIRLYWLRITPLTDRVW
jgi:hypothetical protein